MHEEGSHIWNAVPDNGGTYFVRRIGCEIFWYAEHSDNRWANVFYGIVRPKTGPNFELPNPDGPNRICPPWSTERYPGIRREDELNGHYYDVPKGVTCDSREIAMRTETDVDGTCDWVVHSIIRVNSATGTQRWGSWGSYTRNLGAFAEGRLSIMLAPGWRGVDSTNYSGLWKGDDGGHYYISHASDTGRFVWSAEHPTASPTISVRGEPDREPRGWANVFIGQVSGTLIRGRWADVPKGATRGNGRLGIEVVNNRTLKVIERVGSRYGGTLIQKIDAISVTIALRTLEIRESEDRRGDEPRLHVVFAKIDGDTVDAMELSASTASVLARDSESERWGTGIDSGTVLTIPAEIGQFTSLVKTIPGMDNSRVMVGIAVGAWDEDSSSDSTRQYYSTDWPRMLKSNLDLAVQRNRHPDFIALAGRRHSRHVAFSDEDDHLGYGAKAVSFDDLVNIAADGEQAFEFHMRDDGAHYVVNGTILASSRANPFCGR